MDDIFSEIEDHVLFDEEIMFDEVKIKDYILEFITNRLNSKAEKEKPFFFEEIIYNFFDYMNIDLVKTQKTRDLGIDGIIKLELKMFGDINLGLQIKYKIIDSTDIDMFLSALNNAELQLGVIACKDSRKLEKYNLNSKIRAILLSKGIKTKEQFVKGNIDINPILILKLDEVISIVTSHIRMIIGCIYKK